MLIGSIGTGLLHGSLTAFIVASLSLYFIASPMIGKNKLPIGRLFLTIISASIFLYYSYFNIFNASYNVSGSVLESIQTYQDNVLSSYARSAYKTTGYQSTGLTAIISIPWGLIQYMFEPFPQKIVSIADAILGLENSIRFIMIIGIIYNLYKYDNRDYRIKIIIFFGFYLIQEGIWSLGTVNWGTASRHHVPALGLLLLAAAHSGFLWRRFGAPASASIQRFGDAR